MTAPTKRDLEAEIRRLDAEVARLRAALKSIAQSNLTNEMVQVGQDAGDIRWIKASTIAAAALHDSLERT